MTTRAPSAELRAALGYAARGWRVFPLRGKEPATRHGFKDATTDVDQIERWWTATPDAGIGVPTGEHIDVLDIDHTEYVSGVADLPDCDIESAPLVRTGSGKWHLYVKPTGLGRRIRFSNHCDWLGTNGYVIVPPSVHPDTGARYEWWLIADLPVGPAPDALDRVAMSDAPAELVEFVKHPKRPESTPRAARPPRRAAAGSWSSAGLVGTVVSADVGERNDRLHWAACRIGEDVRSCKAERRDAEAACDELVRVAVLIGLEERSAIATVRSGFGRGVGAA